jgi:hypothetical protein
MLCSRLLVIISKVKAESWGTPAKLPRSHRHNLTYNHTHLSDWHIDCHIHSPIKIATSPAKSK